MRCHADVRETVGEASPGSAGGCWMRNKLELVDVDSDRLEEVLRRAEQSLDEKDAALIRAVFESYAYVTELVEDKNTSIRRLRQLFFGLCMEKTAAVVGEKAEDSDAPSDSAAAAETGLDAEVQGPAESSQSDDAAPSKGHGRTAPMLTAVPRELRSVTRRSLRVTRVPRAARGRFTRRLLECSCGSSGSRRWERRSTNWRNCVAICAVKCSRRPRRSRLARRSTTPQPAA